jgi:hypothetical protein
LSVQRGTQTAAPSSNAALDATFLREPSSLASYFPVYLSFKDTMLATHQLFISSLLALAMIPAPSNTSAPLLQEKSPTVIQKVQKHVEPVEFLLPTPEGSTLDAEQLRGKAVFLCFTAYGSPLLRPLLRQIQTLAEDYPQVQLCLVITNGTQPRDRDFISDADLKAWRNQLPRSYIVARDPRGMLLLQRLELSVIPSFVLLRKDGTVALKREGLDPTTSLVEQIRTNLQQVVQSD